MHTNLVPLLTHTDVDLQEFPSLHSVPSSRYPHLPLSHIPDLHSYFNLHFSPWLSNSFFSLLMQVPNPDMLTSQYFPFEQGLT